MLVLYFFEAILSPNCNAFIMLYAHTCNACVATIINIIDPMFYECFIYSIRKHYVFLRVVSKHYESVLNY